MQKNTLFLKVCLHKQWFSSRTWWQWKNEKNKWKMKKRKQMKKCS
jgi:hypothetical protein